MLMIPTQASRCMALCNVHPPPATLVGSKLYHPPCHQPSLFCYLCCSPQGAQAHCWLADIPCWHRWASSHRSGCSGVLICVLSRMAPCACLLTCLPARLPAPRPSPLTPADSDVAILFYPAAARTRYATSRPLPLQPAICDTSAQTTASEQSIICVVTLTVHPFFSF